MTPKQRAEQLEREGKCIICGVSAKSLVRGLCRMHHGRFKASLKRVRLHKRDAYEAMLIESGQLLPNRQGRRIVDGDDEFAKALAAFERQCLADDAREETVAADKLADQVVDGIVAEGELAAELLSKKPAADKRQVSRSTRKTSANQRRS